MFWQENIVDETFIVPDNILDLSFNIKSKILPIDNIYLLKQALTQKIPWISETNSAIFDISVADGNGWEQDKSGFFYPSKRSKLTLRLPKEYIEKAKELVGESLGLGEYNLEIIKANPVKKLSDSTIIFAKTIPSEHKNEDEFLNECFERLKQIDIMPKKMMAGLQREIKMNDKIIKTRSLMVADLSKADSVKLQELGLGYDKLLGFGVFVPQKGIDTVDAV